jgi:hypothetical protein
VKQGHTREFILLSSYSLVRIVQPSKRRPDSDPDVASHRVHRSDPAPTAHDMAALQLVEEAMKRRP